MSKQLYIVVSLNSPHVHSGSMIGTGRGSHTMPAESLLGFYDDFNYSSIVTPELANYLPDDAVKLYLDYCYFIDNTVEILLSADICNKINNDKNSYYWLFGPHEIMMPKNITSLFQKKNIDLKKIICTTSSFEHDNKIIDGIKYISCPEWWEAQYRYHLTSFKDVSFIAPDKKYQTIKTATKKMLSLNRNVKGHRPWWYNELLDSKLLDESYVSYYIPSTSKNEDYSRENLDRWIKHSIGSIYNYYIGHGFHYPENLDPRLFVDRQLDKLDDTYIINYKKSIVDYYNDSLFSIVSESFYERMFLTEKTFKAITHCHPFIIIGDNTMNRELKRRGYKTYEDIFGAESLMPFVNSPEVISRLEKLTINEIRDMVYQYWDIVEHNWNHFFTRRISWNSVKNKILRVIE